jgi:maltose alpha-D-glucosyltransferase/alpha-amylase
MMQPNWYKNAIFYSLDVETFFDANGDGIGDFHGLTVKLDYLASLGVTCLWLLPFYPSPNRDNGYDIVDYYNVDARLGTLGDFAEFMHQAEERGIRVLLDLVVNHTSNQHPWFQASRSDPDSPFRDYYVWRKDPPEKDFNAVAFPGTQESLWAYDEKAGAYYLHRFYKEQPDLNIANPAVREEICKIMGFWLELGASGFRVDAAPYLIEPLGIEGARAEDLGQFIPTMYDFVRLRRSDAILVAEANVEAERIPFYFGEGDHMQMLFNFLLNQQMFLALARQEAKELELGLQKLPKIPPRTQWLNFVRHHDELNLNHLSEAERQDIFAAFAPEPIMQIYGRGVRRRLPPMVNNHRRHLELVYSLLFTLPGTPLLRYGDEIGMGDDLSLEGRNSVRTPMQWADAKNGGFSLAPADQLPRPMMTQGEYGYSQVNVTSQQRDPNSLINWMERVVRMRKQYFVFGRGDWELIDTPEPCVFAHCCYLPDQAMLAVHNLADDACSTTLNAEHLKDFVEVFSDQPYEAPAGNTIPLGPFGYRWFEVTRKPLHEE